MRITRQYNGRSRPSNEDYKKETQPNVSVLNIYDTRSRY